MKAIDVYPGDHFTVSRTVGLQDGTSEVWESTYLRLCGDECSGHVPTCKVRERRGSRYEAKGMNFPCWTHGETPVEVVDAP